VGSTHSVNRTLLELLSADVYLVMITHLAQTQSKDALTEYEQMPQPQGLSTQEDLIQLVYSVKVTQLRQILADLHPVDQELIAGPQETERCVHVLLGMKGTPTLAVLLTPALRVPVGSMLSVLQMVTVQSVGVPLGILVTHLFAVTLTHALRILVELMLTVNPRGTGLSADVEQTMREIHL